MIRNVQKMIPVKSSEHYVSLVNSQVDSQTASVSNLSVTIPYVSNLNNSSHLNLSNSSHLNSQLMSSDYASIKHNQISVVSGNMEVGQVRGGTTLEDCETGAKKCEINEKLSKNACKGGGI